MKRLLATAAIVLLCCSTASAARKVRHRVSVVTPAPVVHSFYPVGPVYAYPPPVVTVPVIEPPSHLVVPSAAVRRSSVFVAPESVSYQATTRVRRRTVRGSVRVVAPYSVFPPF